MRPAKKLATLAASISLSFVIGVLGSAGGCSDTGGSGDQVKPDPEKDQAVQDKMKEFMAKKTGTPKSK